MRNKNPPRYHAYLLRFWEERLQAEGDTVIWRFSLEDASSGERRGFASLEGLLVFLQEVTAARLADKEEPSE